MTIAEECRRMAGLLSGAPGVADLLNRAANALVDQDPDRLKRVFDNGVFAALGLVRGRMEDLGKIGCDELFALEGRP